MAERKRLSVVALMSVESDYWAVVRRLLAESAAALTQQILALGSDRPLTRLQLEAQRAAIRSYLAQDWSRIQNAIRSGESAAAMAASNVISDEFEKLLRLVLDKETLRRLKQSEARRAASGLQDALLRMGDRKPLSEQVYDTSKLASGYIDDIINKALIQGWNARQLADAVAHTISPSTPGGVSYAANRLARTEINNAFHASAVQRYKDSGIVKEVDWNLSSSHPEGDICDDLQSNSPYPTSRVPHKPHPNCYCYITPHLPTEEEFVENLFRGDYDDEPWMDDVTDDVFKRLSKVFGFKYTGA